MVTRPLTPLYPRFSPTPPPCVVPSTRPFSVAPNLQKPALQVRVVPLLNAAVTGNVPILTTGGTLLGPVLWSACSMLFCYDTEWSPCVEPVARISHQTGQTETNLKLISIFECDRC